MKLYILFFSFLITTICACSDKAYIQHFADIKYTGKDIPTPGFQIKGFYVNSAEWEGKKSDLKESETRFAITAITLLSLNLAQQLSVGQSFTRLVIAVIAKTGKTHMRARVKVHLWTKNTKILF